MDAEVARRNCCPSQTTGARKKEPGGNAPMNSAARTGPSHCQEAYADKESYPPHQVNSWFRYKPEATEIDSSPQ